MLSGLRGVHGLKCGLIYVWGENFETKNSNSIVGSTYRRGWYRSFANSCADRWAKKEKFLRSVSKSLDVSM
jgi:hypothetical protein